MEINKTAQVEVNEPGPKNTFTAQLTSIPFEVLADQEMANLRGGAKIIKRSPGVSSPPVRLKTPPISR